MTEIVQFVEAKSGQTLSVFNPFDESLVTANVHVAGKQDVDDSVAAAEAALTGPWGSFTGAQRAACLNKFADLLESNAEKLAYLDAVCMGMPAAVNAGFIVPTSASVFRC
jgi:aldehyde dehydrogenase (NAD+)